MLWSHLGTTLAKNIVHAKIFQMTVTVVFKFCDLSKCFDPAYICCKVNKFGILKYMLCYEMRTNVYFCIVKSILIKQVIVCLFVWFVWFVCLSVRLWTAKPQGLTG